MHVAGVRFTTLFILTHIKRFFIVFQTNYWTDVFVVGLLAGRAGCGKSVGPELCRLKGILADELFAIKTR